MGCLRSLRTGVPQRRSAVAALALAATVAILAACGTSGTGSRGTSAAGDAGPPPQPRRRTARLACDQVTALSTLIVINPNGEVTYRAIDPPPDKILTALGEAGAR